MIRQEYPPNFNKIQQVFSSYVFDDMPIIFAYWPDIYNPKAIVIPRDILVHEEVHLERQNKNPEEWWNRYLTKINFRLEEELAAYREQYKFAKTIINDRNKLAKGLMRAAHCLASPMYGNIINIQDAIEKIK